MATNQNLRDPDVALEWIWEWRASGEKIATSTGHTDGRSITVRVIDR
ncbi:MULTISPECIES: hypothetical protein [Kitasatospora]|nr:MULTISPECIES: hypothetical protein [Kitasatospora]